MARSIYRFVVVSDYIIVIFYFYAQTRKYFFSCIFISCFVSICVTEICIYYFISITRFYKQCTFLFCSQIIFICKIVSRINIAFICKVSLCCFIRIYIVNYSGVLTNSYTQTSQSRFSICQFFRFFVRVQISIYNRSAMTSSNHQLTFFSSSQFFTIEDFFSSFVILVNNLSCCHFIGICFFKIRSISRNIYTNATQSCFSTCQICSYSIRFKVIFYYFIRVTCFYEQFTFIGISQNETGISKIFQCFRIPKAFDISLSSSIRVQSIIIAIDYIIVILYFYT